MSNTTPRFIKTRVILVIATAAMMLGTIGAVSVWRVMPTCNDSPGMFCKYDSRTMGNGEGDSYFFIFGFPVYF